jgi:hypothetical protein
MRNNNGNLYKWIAGGLLAVVLGYAGTVMASSLDLRERVVSLETSFKFIKEKIEHLDEHFHYGPPEPDEGGQ